MAVEVEEDDRGRRWREEVEQVVSELKGRVVANGGGWVRRQGKRWMCRKVGMERSKKDGVEKVMVKGLKWKGDENGDRIWEW